MSPCELLTPPGEARARLRLPDVSHIVVLRPCAVGDLIFALPALMALHECYPRASITLLGRKWQAEFLTGRPGPIDQVLVMPTVRGVGAPPDAVEDTGEIARFLGALNAQRIDLAIQLYGGGGYSNAFLQQIEARHRVGLRAEGAPPLDRWLPYVYLQNERLRLLETVGLVGAATATLDARLELLPRDIAEAAERVPDDGAPLVVLQPGATDSRRRWPAERFAAVADALADKGATIAINGSADERNLVDTVAAVMSHPAHRLAGRLSLSGLAGLLSRAALLVSNDTGPLHLAQALGTPSVGVYWLSNLLVSSPLTADRHRQAWALGTNCPICGVQNLDMRCEHDASFVADVPVDKVLAPAFALYRGWASRAINCNARASTV